MNTYKCSCGTINTTEWCKNPRCDTRSTSKFKASRQSNTSNWSGNDYMQYTATTDSYSYSYCDSSSTDSSSTDCGGGGGD